jgi:tight junction protein 1
MWRDKMAANIRGPITVVKEITCFVFSDFESVGDDEPTVVATARGYFTSRGGILTSEETGVSIYIPSGAIPPGIEQEIYFKVCNDNSMLPPLDTEKGKCRFSKLLVGFTLLFCNFLDKQALSCVVGETLLSPLVMCGPNGTKFLKAVELRLPHSAAMTPEGWSFALNSSNNSSGIIIICVFLELFAV